MAAGRLKGNVNSSGVPLASLASSMLRDPVADVDKVTLAQLCTRYGVARLMVFGSIARGDARSDSDVDILYELLPGRRPGWDIEDLSDELTTIFGRPVDLVSFSALNNRLREPVLAEARHLSMDDQVRLSAGQATPSG